MRKYQHLIYPFLGALIPGIIILSQFIKLQVWPFGQETILIVDSLHQYLPFFTELHEKLTSGDSLIYSFSGGLGYDFWNTIAYYLACPFNFLVALVPKKHICDFMDYMILFKIAACGGCFTWYTYKRNRSIGIMSVALGCMYALSNFILGYNFNLMWLDSIAMLPVIMYGIEKIAEGCKGNLFFVSLAYGIWCNYYIGFMLCVFSCLYFLVCISNARHGFFRKTGIFIINSFFAGAACSILLLPAAAGLADTQSVNGSFGPGKAHFFLNIEEILKSMLYKTEPVTLSSGQEALNVYCGMAALLLIILYILNREINIIEKISHIALFIFLAISFSFNWLNYIWHGFHIQNGLPNRFSFIFIALMLSMSGDVLGKMAGIRRIGMAFGGLIPYVICAYWYLSSPKEQFLSCMVWIVVYYVLFIMLYAGWKRTTPILLLISVIVEMGLNASAGLKSNGTTNKEFYIATQATYGELVQEEGFYRAEVAQSQMRNFSIFSGSNSIVLFNSTMKGSVTSFMGKLGIEARMNKTGYLGVTKLFNDIFCIKYVMTRDTDADALNRFYKINQKNGYSLYKNDNALSVGFMVDDSIRNWDIEGNPMEVQNSFIKTATGKEGIFTKQQEAILQNGTKYSVRIPQNTQVFLWLQNNVDTLKLETPEFSRRYNTYTDFIYPLTAEEEGKARIQIDGENGKGVLYSCTDNDYEAVIQELGRTQMQDVTVQGNRLSGSIHVKDAGTLLLTIPYDENWKVEVDGKEVSYYAIADTLIGVDMDPGDHTIFLTYKPRVIYIGGVMSLAAIFIYLIVVNRKNDFTSYIRSY